jgi:hypothetical protein
MGRFSGAELVFEEDPSVSPSCVDGAQTGRFFEISDGQIRHFMADFNLYNGIGGENERPTAQNSKLLSGGGSGFACGS